MNSQQQESVFSTCKECGEDERTDDLTDAMLCRLCACTHERVECPRHEGNFDCNPFCRLCEGDQEWCPTCDTHEHEWDTTSERTHCLVCEVVE